MNYQAKIKDLLDMLPSYSGREQITIADFAKFCNAKYITCYRAAKKLSSVDGRLYDAVAFARVMDETKRGRPTGSKTKNKRNETIK